MANQCPVHGCAVSTAYNKKKCRCSSCTEWKQLYDYDHTNKERKKINDRRSHLKCHYDLSLEDYDRMVEEQSNCCAICGKEMDIPCVDHCHKTGKVRGLLCNQCNRGLGFLQDDVQVIAKAIEYLEATTNH